MVKGKLASAGKTSQLLLNISSPCDKIKLSPFVFVRSKIVMLYILKNKQRQYLALANNS